MGFFDKLLGRRDLNLRKPRFDGMLYPADAAELETMLESLSAQTQPGEQTPRALIVPHAEYAFAGPVMARAWTSVRGARAAIEQVVLIGSSRLVPFRGLAVTGYDGFDTPLGPLLFDKEAVSTLAQLEQVRAIEPAFDPEASLEAQLPFVRHILGEVSIVPVLVGDSTDEEVEEVIAGSMEDPATLVVVSANLSNDVSAERAEALDEASARAIEALAPQQLGREHSLGRVAIRGLLRAAKARNLRAELLERRTSADTAAEITSAVTGYAAFAFYAENTD